MADNIAVTPGSGENVGFDEVTTLNGVGVAAVKIQRVKPSVGVDGAATDVSSTNPLPVSATDPEMGLSQGMTSYRDNLVAQRYTILADSFADGINTWWTTTNANGGTFTSTAGEGLLATSTATNGSTHVTSASVDYLPGQTGWFNNATRFGDTGVAGNIRRLGLYTVSGTTPQEGFYYELNGTTFNAVTVKAGTATAVASGSWSKNATAPFTLDANYHFFEIRYTGNTVWFYIDSVLRHVVTGTTSPLTSTLNLPMAMTNVKTSGATNITMGVRNIGMGRFGTPMVDTDGLQTVRLNFPLREMRFERVADTTGNSTAFANFTAVAGARNVITSLAVYNTSATAGYVDFRDGTAGSVLWTLPLPAGGGAVLADPTGMFRTSINTALAYDVSAALTTAYVSVSGFQSKA